MGVTPTTESHTTNSERSTMNRPPVYRQLALPVPVFDYIKDCQRAYMARTGEHLSINQTVVPSCWVTNKTKNVKYVTSKANNQPSSAPASEPLWVEQWVPLGSIRQLQALQVRHKLNPSAVKTYRDWTAAGKVPPPIKLGRTKTGDLFLVDGWHRMEAGALQTAEGFDALDGSEVLALVADLTEEEIRWEAARANMGHGVALMGSEYRAVFRAFVKAGKHRDAKGRLLSYRDMAPMVGKGHTTLRNWMQKDFPSVFAAMGGDEHGNTRAQQPPLEVRTLADEQCDEAVKAAQAARLAMAGMSPQQRYRVAESLRAALCEAERHGVEAEHHSEEAEEF